MPEDRQGRHIPSRGSNPDYGAREVPDFFEKVPALRIWRYTPDARLVSLMTHVTWPVGEELEAQCLRSRWIPATDAMNCSEPVPNMHHGCGIYGVKRMDTVEDIVFYYSGGHAARRPGSVVAGKVLMWGRMLEGSYGYRAQFAECAALASELNPAAAEEAAAKYGVPIFSWEEMVAEVAKWGSKVKLPANQDG